MKKVLKLLIPATTLLVPVSAVGCSCSTTFVAFPEEYLNINSSNVLLGFKESYDSQDKLQGYNTLTIPAKITTLQDGTFAYDGKSVQDGSLAIKKVDYEGEDNSCTKFGNSSFSGCINLETVIFPPNFTSTDENLFGGCKSLSTLDFSHVIGELLFKDTMFTYDYAIKGKIIITKKDQVFAKSLLEKLMDAGCKWDIEEVK